jgi:hypothetical protein
VSELLAVLGRRAHIIRGRDHWIVVAGGRKTSGCSGFAGSRGLTNYVGDVARGRDRGSTVRAPACLSRANAAWVRVISGQLDT